MSVMNMNRADFMGFENMRSGGFGGGNGKQSSYLDSMKSIFSFLGPYFSKNIDFDAVRLSIASPEDIRNWSYGEVKKPDTLNYRTVKPEPAGLFCSRIFGPVRDYECSCGKYKRAKNRNIVCEKCGVEVTTSKVRRERMGHIELAAPVVHIWFMRSLPARIPMLLDIASKDIDDVLYFKSYIVSNPGATPYKYGQLISESEYYRAVEMYGITAFEAGMGAETIRKMLAEFDLSETAKILKSELIRTNSESKRKKLVRRLKLIDNFIQSGNRPEWMVMEVLPVLPPDLRPLVMLDGGRFATSELNDLYRRVINRNNRLRRLLELRAPDIIIRNEKRMLQEAVDALLDNSRKGSKAVASKQMRQLKSLADMLKGKHGRFRQNLLGKRVDYSGRSVIVVGPELKLHQCGLPKKMALELFKPFIYAKLELYGICGTLKAAKKMVENQRPEVWDMLEEVIKNHPVLLNRAPTLHRVGIQAFEPLLIEGKAIQLHPLVCTAFNADFDGDQIAVHVPLSIEAQLEARILMMSTNNVLSPANGKPIIVPTKDIILGLYYMTLEMENQKGEGSIFGGIAEVMHALNADLLSLHAKIRCRCKILDVEGHEVEHLVETTPGRVMVSELLPKNAHISFDNINRVLTKKEVSTLIELVYKHCGKESTGRFADDLMQLGFSFATTSGISFGKDDIIIPPSKETYLRATREEVEKYHQQYHHGLITNGERYNKTVDAWSRCGDKIANDMMLILSGRTQVDNLCIGENNQNNIYMMSDSGARGSAAQIRQLGSMRGLMAKPSGEIIEIPITSNFKEGLSVMEYFHSTHGARKGLADTALKTANSGYLTRKLVDVAQDCVITDFDCGSEDGLIIKPEVENGEIVVSLAELVIGRVAANVIKHPVNDSLIVDKGQIIDEQLVEMIEEAGIDSVKIRSPLMCKRPVRGGLCAKCYGQDLADGSIVNLGEAVGIIAAQSIGEPGTQLTMRTFHIGGAAQKTTVQSNIVASHSGWMRFVHKNIVVDSKDRNIVMSRNCEAVIADEAGCEKARYKVPYGARLLINDKDIVKAGQIIVEWDPFTAPIITEKSGIANFVDLIKGVSMKEVQDEVTGIVNRVVTDSKQQSKGHTDLQPKIVLTDDDGNVLILANGLEARYFLPVDAILSISDKEKVNAGDIIARIPKESSKSKDITGGLPRVVELFEARQSKDYSIISEVDGYVEFGKDYKSKRRVVVRSANENKDVLKEYFIPRGRHITVNEGDYVSKGDMLMEGNPSPHDILQIMGVELLAQHIISEVQQVYRLQGVLINNKHIEVILSQMLQKVEVTDPGGTIFLLGEQVDLDEFRAENETVMLSGLEPAKAIAVLQGITKASLQTKSFFSAASFQETTRILTEAAIAGKVDELRGLKENVIVGRPIPAGTGLILAEFKKQAKAKDRELELMYKGANATS